MTGHHRQHHDAAAAAAALADMSLDGRCLSLPDRLDRPAHLPGTVNK